MGFAILRTKKLKSKLSVLLSLKHSHREQDTPNADPAKLDHNGIVIGSDSADKAFKEFSKLLPEKIRKNGVICIEYLITGSPDNIHKMTRLQQDKYFEDATKWLQETHGEKNVFHVGIHRDETTPHMFAYVIPYDPKGKMNARHFLGGSDKLSKMQTDFHEKVAVNYGLERGIKGSKAKHQKVKRFYSQINQPDQKIQITAEDVVPQKTSFFSKETPADVADRINEDLKDKLQPTLSLVKTTKGDQERASQLIRTGLKMNEENTSLKMSLSSRIKKVEDSATKQILVINSENVRLNKKVRQFEEDFEPFFKGLNSEDLEELARIAEELRIARIQQEEQYFVNKMLQEHPTQHEQIKNMYPNAKYSDSLKPDSPAPNEQVQAEIDNDFESEIRMR